MMGNNIVMKRFFQEIGLHRIKKDCTDYKKLLNFGSFRSKND